MLSGVELLLLRDGRGGGGGSCIGEVLGMEVMCGLVVAGGVRALVRWWGARNGGDVWVGGGGGLWCVGALVECSECR